MTEYVPLQNIETPESDLLGGLCKWWFIPIEYITVFPDFDPINQQLTAEPEILDNVTWFGPVIVPDHTLGWTQTPQQDKRGIWYQQKVQGFVPGNSAANYINLGNLAFHKFCIVGRLRTNNMLVVLGNNEAGLDFFEDTSAGVGAEDLPGTAIMFTGETIHKAFLLPEFYINDDSPFIADDDGEAIIDHDGDTIPYN